MELTSIDEVLLFNEEQCTAAVSAFKRDLQKVRTGRASSGIVEGISVDYYGAKTPLTHLAQISTPEARLILVQVYDSGAVQAVEKAIMGSDLGFNPSRDGNTLRINVPPLTEESRKEIVRHLHRMAEDIKVSIRNHRRDSNDALKKLEKENSLSKDEVKRGQEKIQKQTDSYTAEVDALLQTKEAECMEV